MRELPRRIVTRPVPFADPADVAPVPASGAAAVLRATAPAPLSLQPATQVNWLEEGPAAAVEVARASLLPPRSWRCGMVGLAVLAEVAEVGV